MYIKRTKEEGDNSGANFLYLFEIKLVIIWTDCFKWRWYLQSQGQFSSVAQSCPVLYNPMDCSTPGFPVHHQLPELAQTHVHQVGDAIQPTHPLLFPSPPTLNLSQHQGLFLFSRATNNKLNKKYRGKVLARESIGISIYLMQKETVMEK